MAALPEDERRAGIERILGEAEAESRRERRPLVECVLRRYEELRGPQGAEAKAPGDTPPAFLCDSSLGGLARWLHAAGYEARTASEAPPHRLPDEALRLGLVLLTTDSETLERRIVADGSLPVVWLPSALTTAEKLQLVMRDLRLPLRPPRCMACGGQLLPRAKEEVRPRIPPRTARWKDEYFVCAGCDRLYWEGTHWQRIVPALRRAAAA